MTASISVFSHVFSGCACSYPRQCSAPDVPSIPYFTPSKRPFMMPPWRKRPSLPLHIYLCNCLRCHGDDSGTQSDWQTRLWHSILPGSIYLRPELQPATQTKSQLHTCTHTYEQTIYGWGTSLCWPNRIYIRQKGGNYWWVAAESWCRSVL